MANSNSSSNFTTEGVSADHVPDYGTDDHPRPSAAEAIERSRMRHPASDRTQRTIWRWFFIGLGLLLAIAIVVGLRQRRAQPRVEPAPPAQSEAP